jgi:hypothetical protein
MAEPVFSPDGKFMWTGSEWIPSPPNIRDEAVKTRPEFKAESYEIEEQGKLILRTKLSNIWDGINQTAFTISDIKESLLSMGSHNVNQLFNVFKKFNKQEIDHNTIKWVKSKSLSLCEMTFIFSITENSDNGQGSLDLIIDSWHNRIGRFACRPHQDIFKKLEHLENPDCHETRPDKLGWQKAVLSKIVYYFDLATNHDNQNITWVTCKMKGKFGDPEYLCRKNEIPRYIGIRGKEKKFAITDVINPRSNQNSSARQPQNSQPQHSGYSTNGDSFLKKQTMLANMRLHGIRKCKKCGHRDDNALFCPICNGRMIS